MKSNVLEDFRKGLIVSCQALENEPLHSSFIMGKMATAALEGGAIGIRANGKDDIIEIKKNVDLPVIGIVKRDYDDSDVYITPTMKEVKELLEANVEVIAMDATISKRPDGVELSSIVKQTRDLNANVLLMADCSTFDEVKLAVVLGFDIISSTLVGYTKHSKGLDVSADDYKLLKEMIKYVHDHEKFFIAEGNIDTEDKIKNAVKLKADSIVVGSMITRPQLITKRFVSYVQDAKGESC